MSQQRLLVGADIGGTFTDLVIIDRDTGKTTNVKTLTTPEDPAKGVLTAVREGLDLVKAPASAVERFVHATTLPTNLVLERKGARVAFVTTAGFGDMFDISRQYPSGGDRFNLRWQRPPALIERSLTVQVRERVRASGKVTRPLDAEHLKAELERIAPLNPEAFAICLLHSYANGKHEEMVRDIIAARFPGLLVSLSSEVWPEYREYERASATVLSAYVGPTLSQYVRRLEDALHGMGIPAGLQIMQSSGAIMRVTEAARRAAYTIESGPAAGLIAAAYTGVACNRPDVISFDMGGTTAKAGLVVGGRPTMAHEFRVGGRASASGQREAGEPIRIPVIDLAEVGAGGGSIAWVDAGNHLRLGPHSAGANPGPACYDRGGTDPTVTDANVILGYLDASYFNGGKMTIRPELAHKAIEEKVAKPLGLSVVDAARGIHSLANTLMGAAIRMVTLQRGIDPRDHGIIAFGGAGPVHIVNLAQLFSIPEVIVPPSPGVKSAYGLLVSDIAYDTVRTVIMPLNTADLASLNQVFDDLTKQARTMLGDEEKRGADIIIERSLDMAFSQKAQSHPVPIADGSITTDLLKKADADYRALQVRMFNLESADTCKIVGARVRISARTPAPPEALAPKAQGSADAAIKNRRPAWFDAASDFVETPVYDRTRLAAGHVIQGPAIFEEADATTICPPGFTVAVDDKLNLLITASKEAKKQARSAAPAMAE